MEYHLRNLFPGNCKTEAVIGGNIASRRDTEQHSRVHFTSNSWCERNLAGGNGVGDRDSDRSCIFYEKRAWVIGASHPQ